MKKLILSLVSVFLFITGYCYDLPQYNNTPVNDFAKVLKSPTDLVNIISDANIQSGTQIVVVTIPNLPDGVSINDYARDLGNAWSIGSYYKNGILILLSIGDRKSRIAVGSNLTSVITNEVATNAAKQMSPYFKQGDYDNGLMQGIQYLKDYVIQYNQYVEPYKGNVPQVNSVSDSTKTGSIWGIILYTILFLILFGGIFYINSLYKKDKAEKIATSKKMVNDKISALEKFIEKLIGISKNANLLPIIDGVSINSLIPSLQEHVRYYNLLNISEDRNYTDAQLSYFNRIDIESIKRVVNQHIRNNDKYESFKYKTNASYLNKIEDEVKETKMFISLIKGEFLDTNAVEIFEKGVIEYNNLISNKVIDKTNFETWQKSIDELEDCVTFFKKNVCNPLNNKLREGHEKTDFIFKVRISFNLILNLKESMTKQIWCSESTKEKVLNAINNYKHKFGLIPIPYTNSSYNKLNELFKEIEKDYVFNLLTSEKEEYEREEERKREEEREKEREEARRRRRNYSSSRSSSHTNIVNNNGGYGYGYGGGTTIIVDDNNNNGFFSSGNDNFSEPDTNFSEPDTNFGDVGGNDSW